MTHNQAPAKDMETAAFWQDVANKYQRSCLAAEEALNTAKAQASRCEKEYEQTDEMAFLAESEVNEYEKKLREAAERALMLASEEVEKRTAAQLANTLADDALKAKINNNTDYSELYNKALEALLSVSAAAETELAEIQKALLGAEKNKSDIQLETITATLFMRISRLKKSGADRARFAADQRSAIAELEAAVYRDRMTIAQKTAAIAALRKSLDETMDAYRRIAAEAIQLEDNEHRRSQLLEKLNADLEKIGLDILPYKNRLNELISAEQNTLYQLETAKAEAAYAEKQYTAAEENLAQKQRAAAEYKIQAQTEEENFRQQAKQTADQTNEKIVSLQMEKQVLESTVNEQQAAYQRAGETADQLQQQIDALQIALKNAYSTIEKTEQMITNAQNAKSAIKNKSLSVLAGTETILENTLKSTRALTDEQEAACKAAQNQLEEQQAIKAAAQNDIKAMRKRLKTINLELAEAGQFRQQMESAAEENWLALSSHLTQRIAAAEQAAALAAADYQDALALKENKSRDAQELEEKLAGLIAERTTVEEECAKVQEQIAELNEQIEAEAAAGTDDLDRRLLAFWEQCERLRTQAQDKHNEIKRLIEAAHRLATAEYEHKTELSATLHHAQEQQSKLLKQNELLGKELQETRDKLIAALDEFRKNNSRQSPAVKKALATLDESYLTEQDLTQVLPDAYQSGLEASLDYHVDLLTQPVPGIDIEPYKPQYVSIEQLIDEANKNEAPKTAAPDEGGAAVDDSQPLNSDLNTDQFGEEEAVDEAGPPITEEETADLDVASLLDAIAKQISAGGPYVYDPAEKTPMPSLAAAEQPAAPEDRQPDTEQPPIAETTGPPEPEAPSSSEPKPDAQISEAESITPAVPSPPAENVLLALEIEELRNMLSVEQAAAAASEPEPEITAAPSSQADPAGPALAEAPEATAAYTAEPVEREAAAPVASSSRQQEITQPGELAETVASEIIFLTDDPEATEHGDDPAARLARISEAARLDAEKAAQDLAYHREEKRRERAKQRADEEARRLASEIDNIRIAVTDVPPEEAIESTAEQTARQQAEEEERRAEEERHAALESARIAAEEQAAQAKAEAEAARQKAERRAKEQAEAERLANIAARINEKISTSNKASALKAAAPAVKTAPPAAESDEGDNDDDIEAELRRLIFPDKK